MCDLGQPSKCGLGDWAANWLCGNAIEPRGQLMANTVRMASCPSQLVRVPVQSNIQRLSQAVKMSGRIQKRL